jgi:hypothetical protein
MDPAWKRMETTVLTMMVVTMVLIQMVPVILTPCAGATGYAIRP